MANRHVLFRIGCILAVGLLAAPVQGQDFWMGERTFSGYQVVQIPPGVHPSIVVTEFWTHGDLRPDGANLLVVDGRFRPVPRRFLQLGPGDSCRLAFQTTAQQKTYRIYYGGPVSEEKCPAWTDHSGLVLETRRWKQCDLNQASSLREAFLSAQPVGSDYVSGVFHRFNPLDPSPEPFLSRYAGTLHVAIPGTYLFYTSSQDCSFLLIDNTVVVAAPGRHGPVHDARIVGSVSLNPGPHSFEYLHAAAGADACMVAAWQFPRIGKPEPITDKAFRGELVLHLPAGGFHNRHGGALPDFSLEVIGEVPVADSDLPLVAVHFKDMSGLARHGHAHWDFGDGQSSERPEPIHVFLRPGLYTVKLSLRSSSPSPEVVSRVVIHRPALLADKAQSNRLADYLPLIELYNPTTMDFAAVLQFARVLGQTDRIPRAAASGKGALVDGRPNAAESDVLALARLIGPWLRDTLDKPEGAVEAWLAAARLVHDPSARGECEVEAADILLHDLLRRAEAKPLLTLAAAHMAGADAERRARLQRLWGDWHARAGDGAAARAAYGLSMAALANRQTAVEQDAWRGAFSRSTEAFLRQMELDRALQELRRWQDQFPLDKVEGYLLLLQARHSIARGKFAQAIALAGDLVALNRDSPYADQLAFLAAECEEKLGRPDRAAAGWKSFLNDFPGSPLVPDARKRLSRPAGSQTPKPVRPVAR